MKKLDVKMAPSNCYECGTKTEFTKGERFSDLREIYSLKIGKCVGLAKCKDQIQTSIRDKPKLLKAKIKNTELNQKVDYVIHKIITLYQAKEGSITDFGDLIINNEKANTYYQFQFETTKGVKISMIQPSHRKDGLIITLPNTGITFSCNSRPEEKYNEDITQLLVHLNELKGKLEAI